MNHLPGDNRRGTTDSTERTTNASVLVVDDDWDMRELVTSRLALEGYSVLQASSGAELLHIGRRTPDDRLEIEGVDIVVLDHRMPGMTGLEAIRRLRAARCETPAILMTAFPEADVMAEARALGVSILAKPFSFDLLIDAIRVTLDSDESAVRRVSS